MTLFQSLFLGALQGVAEFLPVSSSGHLVVFRNFMDLGEIPVLFDIMLHGATLLVVLIVFRRTIGSLLASLWRFIIRRQEPADRTNLRLILVILLASVFTAGLGLVIESLDVGSSPRIVAVLFFVTAAVLLGTRFIKTPGGGGYEKAGVKTAIITGIAQGLAVLPGISRSGITISSALFAGLSREKAGEYSFILSIPAIAGAMILQMKDFELLSKSVSSAVLLAGMAAAFVVGLASILLLLRLVRKSRLYFFSFYLIPFGIISLIIL